MNQYVSFSATVSTNTEGAALVFFCPADNGTIVDPAGWPYARKPTCYDRFGSSYLYNSSANNNDGQRGLVGKRSDQVRNAAKTILVNDVSFNMYFRNNNPFQLAYWHNKKVSGFGSVAFVDGHVAYYLATRNKPAFQRGIGWSFIYNDP